MSHFPWIPDELGKLQAADLLRRRRTIRPHADGWCDVDGQQSHDLGLIDLDAENADRHRTVRRDSETITFRVRDHASNDYLNLAHDPRLIEAARMALEESGVGARASAVICGRTHWHERLERKLAEFEGQEAAMLFPSGYAANMGTIRALVDENDFVFCDRLNHASLVDGCRLSRAKLQVYRHTNLDGLERSLQKAQSARRRLIVTDSIFSMDGTLAPLRELCEIAETYSAQLLIDEAHGTGVFGELGRGVAEMLGLEERIAVRVGTLSKAVGCLGGFVAGDKSLIDWLWNMSRTGTYSTALPPSVCAAACVAIDIVRDDLPRRTHLAECSNLLRKRLLEADVPTLSNAVGPIVPILLKSEDAALKAAEFLERRGILVGAIRPPTVPKGTSRLRITLSAAHTIEEIENLATTIADAVADQLG